MKGPVEEYEQLIDKTKNSNKKVNNKTKKV